MRIISADQRVLAADHFLLFRVLDFKKIKQKEREAAKSLYKSKEGKTQLKDIERKAKTFVPGEPLPEATNKNTNAAGLTPDQVESLELLGLCLQLVIPGPTDQDDDSQGRVPQRGGETDADAEGRPDAGHGDPEWIRGDGAVRRDCSSFPPHLTIHFNKIMS